MRVSIQMERKEEPDGALRIVHIDKWFDVSQIVSVDAARWS